VVPKRRRRGGDALGAAVRRGRRPNDTPDRPALYPLGPDTIERDGTVQVAVDRTSRPELVQVADADADDGPFDLRIESAYATAWRRYFEQTHGFSVNESATDTANGTVVADLDHSDEVFIPDGAVNIRLQR